MPASPNLISLGARSCPVIRMTVVLPRVADRGWVDRHSGLGFGGSSAMAGAWVRRDKATTKHTKSTNGFITDAAHFLIPAVTTDGGPSNSVRSSLPSGSDQK